MLNLTIHMTGTYQLAIIHTFIALREMKLKLGFINRNLLRFNQNGIWT